MLRRTRERKDGRGRKGRRTERKEGEKSNVRAPSPSTNSQEVRGKAASKQTKHNQCLHTSTDQNRPTGTKKYARYKDRDEKCRVLFLHLAFFWCASLWTWQTSFRVIACVKLLTR